MTEPVDLVGIGNSILDILCLAQDADLNKMKLDKGMMTLVDDSQVRKLKETANANAMQSGGSVANTISHYAELGGQAHFIGKIADDAVGAAFRQDILDLGIRYRTAVTTSESMTGCCHIFVTPDAQRTMCTYLGASAELTSADLDEEEISQAHIVLIEGYLWDLQGAIEMFDKAARIAKNSETLVALSLSDPMLVQRHKDDLYRYVKESVDIVFANELEAQSLSDTDSWENAMSALQPIVEHLIITRGEQGSVVSKANTLYARAADQVAEVVDTTGAGDAYAGGYLYGLTRNWTIEECMDVASRTAAGTVSHMGARPGKS